MAIKDQVNQELNSTELGKALWKFRIPIISVIAAVLIGVIVMGVSSYQKEAAHKKYSGVIYQFGKTDLKALQEKKLDAKKYLQLFDKLIEQTGSYKGLAPLILSSSDVLAELGNMEEAGKILERGEKEFLGENVFLDSFLLTRIAVVNENLGNDQKALSALEKLVKLPQKFLEGKIYLDLGRLYSKVGKVDKAKASFQYVVEKIKDKDFNKLAKIYLEELKGK